MKKNYLLIILFILSIGFSKVSAQQCTPDPNFNQAGIAPDSATNLPPAYVGTAYTAVMTAVVPLDTSSGGVPARIEKICVTNFVQPNLTGFSWTTNVPQNCFPGGAKNCLIMTANPVASDIGIHTMVITLVTTAKIGGVIPYTQTDEIDYYQIVVNPAAGISVSDARKFFAMKNVPNPFANSTDVHFNAPKAENYTFVVTNFLGQVVLDETINAVKGPNKYSFDASNLPKGVYIYTLSNGIYNFTERMVVQK